MRGYSISDHEPSASVTFTYDDPSGAYVGASLIGSIYEGSPVLLGIQGNAGYALRVTPTLSLDAGVSKTKYLYAFDRKGDYDYTELYVGAALPFISTRLSYSPDYYDNDLETLYAELETGFSPADKLFLSAHGGVLAYLGEPPPYLPDQTFDWRVGATREIGPWAVHLDVSGRVLGRARFSGPGGVGSGEDREALVLSLTRTF